MSRSYPYNDYPYNGYSCQGHPYTNYPCGDLEEGGSKGMSRSHSDGASGSSTILSILVLFGFAVWLSVKLIRFVFWLLRLIFLHSKKEIRNPGLFQIE